jgi:hypothetical protein
MPGKYSQASRSAPPSEEKLNPPGGKKGVLVNTPTLAWAYTRTFKERGREEILNSVDIGSFSNYKEDDVYLNKKFQQ